jgi:hypothetical protein
MLCAEGGRKTPKEPTDRSALRADSATSHASPGGSSDAPQKSLAGPSSISELLADLSAEPRDDKLCICECTSIFYGPSGRYPFSAFSNALALHPPENLSASSGHPQNFSKNPLHKIREKNILVTHRFSFSSSLFSGMAGETRA